MATSNFAASVIPPVPSITAQDDGPSLELIVSQAKARVANHLEVRDDLDLIDMSLMVIEDVIGSLVYTKGDLSFLMTGAPVIGKSFAYQINLDVADEYEAVQFAVWPRKGRPLVDGKQFQIAPNWNAAIMPFLAKEDRFTVTVFIRRMAN